MIFFCFDYFRCKLFVSKSVEGSYFGCMGFGSVNLWFFYYGCYKGGFLKVIIEYKE